MAMFKKLLACAREIGRGGGYFLRNRQTFTVDVVVEDTGVEEGDDIGAVTCMALVGCCN
jgi:hypothetical protein